MKDSNVFKYDAFISHAVEDKIPIANELCDRLVKAGLKIWYSGKELSVGDSIAETIKDGLDQCRFGIVILSHHYINKTWTLREFYSLMARETDDRKVILPVLHDITPTELALKDLSMADRFAIRSDKGLEYVTEVLIGEIKKHHEAFKLATAKKRQQKSRKQLKQYQLWVLAFLVSMICMYTIANRHPAGPDNQVIENAVRKRIEELQHSADQDFRKLMASYNGRPSSREEITNRYETYRNLPVPDINVYTLNTGYDTRHVKRDIEEYLQVKLEPVVPENYAWVAPVFYLLQDSSVNHERSVWYTFKNEQPVSFTQGALEKRADHEYSLDIRYKNNLRYVYTTLVFASPLTPAGNLKRREVTLVGMLPLETYVFVKNQNEWSVAVAR